jgi:signal transduction histidine kinase/ActR/RegA family two-component response regulator
VTQREKAVQVREQLLIQLREANGKLVAAALRADELLEAAVTTSAAELRASEELLRARESKALETNRAKDEFLAILGHELRGPLAPMRIALDVIAMDTADTHRREHKLIERQMMLIVHLVDDLLDVSRIVNRKIVLRRKSLELADIVTQAVELASPLIESRGHTLTVSVPDHGLTLDGDMHRLIQVVANLLTNAAKYTEPRGLIAVTGERRGPNVLLRVRDNGIGISKEMLPRIFDLFAQEEQPAEHAPGGLGLGLPIVRSLVTLHGGTVTAHSEGPGRGTELVVELPALAKPAEATIQPPARGAARRILVVDDNRLVAELTHMALTKLGHDVRMAFDGPSALAVVAGFVPEIVLLDIELPGIDGYEVAKRLRTALAPHELHFIATSGRGQDSDRLRSANAKFDDYLVKPVDLWTLQRRIERIPDASAHEIAHGAEST